MSEGKFSKNDTQKLFETILERDKLLSEKEETINCLKTAKDRLDQEIRDLKENIKQVSSELKHFPSVEPLQYIKESITTAILVNHRSLIDYKTLEISMKEKIKQKEEELQETKQKCEKNYLDAIEKLRQKPQYQELETVKSEWLKLDIERRQHEEKIKLQKKIYDQKKEIADQLYYMEFVELAEHVLINQEIQKLETMKRREKEEIRKLYDLQERVKLKQQMPAYHEKLGQLSEITLGNGEVPPEKRFSKPEIKIGQKIPIPQATIFQELGSMFVDPLSQETTALTIKPSKKENVSPSKIRVLDTKILAPSFANEPLTSAVQQKHKKRVAFDVASQYRKISEKLEKKLKTSIDQLSQQSQSNSQLWSSQQSCQAENLSRSQLSSVNEQFVQSQPETQCETQLTTIMIEDTQMTNTERAIEEIESENAEYIRESPICVEKIMPSPTPRLQSIMKNSQNSQPRTFQNIYKKNSQSEKFHPHGKGDAQRHGQFTTSFSKKKLDKSPFVIPNASVTSFVEPQKTVRFNLDSESKKKESSSNMGMFGNNFGFVLPKSSFNSFFGGGILEGQQEKTSGENSMNNTMNNTLTDMDNSCMTGPNASTSIIHSPDFSYEDEPTIAENKQETNTGGFMGAFGRGFPFGKSSMFNF